MTEPTLEDFFLSKNDLPALVRQLNYERRTFFAVFVLVLMIPILIIYYKTNSIMYSLVSSMYLLAGTTILLGITYLLLSNLFPRLVNRNHSKKVQSLAPLERFKRYRSAISSYNAQLKDSQSRASQITEIVSGIANGQLSPEELKDIHQRVTKR